ncbi:hypothetical protein D3C85_1313760 [compost metagenome]
MNVDELRGSAAPTQRQPAAADVTDVESRDTKSARAAPDTAPAKAQAETDDPAQTAAPDVTTNADPTAGAAEDDGGEALDPAKVEEQLRAAKSLDVLDIAADYLPGIADIEERDRLNRLYQQLRLSLTSAQQRTPRRRVAAPE